MCSKCIIRFLCRAGDNRLLSLSYLSSDGRLVGVKHTSHTVQRKSRIGLPGREDLDQYVWKSTVKGETGLYFAIQLYNNLAAVSKCVLSLQQQKVCMSKYILPKATY